MVWFYGSNQTQRRPVSCCIMLCYLYLFVLFGFLLVVSLIQFHLTCYSILLNMLSDDNILIAWSQPDSFPFLTNLTNLQVFFLTKQKHTLSIRKLAPQNWHHHFEIPKHPSSWLPGPDSQDRIASSYLPWSPQEGPCTQPLGFSCLKKINKFSAGVLWGMLLFSYILPIFVSRKQLQCMNISYNR